MPHINRALVSSGHSPMYVMHKFFGRKQEDVIREYLKVYSNENEVVLDPFCGSGVIIGEAVKLKRKALGLDINPMSIFISRNTLLPVNFIDIENEFNRLSIELSEDIEALYETYCRKFHTKVSAICYTWNNNRLIDVRYNCPSHGKQIHLIDSSDQELLKRIEIGKIPSFFDERGVCKYWYPRNSLSYDENTPFLKKERYNSIDELFTIRNLISLSKLYSYIDKIEKPELKASFKFAFTSMTHLASKMTPVRSSRPYSSAWVQQSYWYCPEFMESNVWLLFKRAIHGKQGLIKAKKYLRNQELEPNESPTLEKLFTSNIHNFYLIQDTLDDITELKPESVDYVITDPPYGYSIQYGELLFMWGAWIGISNEFQDYIKKEIVINPRQKKDERLYEEMLLKVFKRIYFVLKPSKYCTVTFHNPKLKFRNILVRTALTAGFNLEKIIYQPPSRPSAKSLLQPFGSLDGDYFFRFKKAIPDYTSETNEIDELELENLIIEKVKEILIERAEPTHYTFIQNALDPLLYYALKKKGQILGFQPESVEKILQKYEGRVFELVPIKFRKIGTKELIQKAWWLKKASAYDMKEPLSTRILNTINNILTNEKGVSTKVIQDIIFEKYQDALTPDLNLILEILEQIGMYNRGKWTIKISEDA